MRTPVQAIQREMDKSAGDNGTDEKNNSPRRKFAGVRCGLYPTEMHRIESAEEEVSQNLRFVQLCQSKNPADHFRLSSFCP